MSITLTAIHRPRSASLSLGGEPTGTPGLLITPAVSRGGCYTGGWTVTHAESGMHVGFASTTLAYARELAALLAPVDWTRAGRDLATDPAARDRVRDAEQRHLVAAAEHEPLWWARGSWTQHAPRWVLHTAEPAMLTWRRVVAEADAAATLPADTVTAPVTFDPRPVWTLRCAAPGCDPVVLDDGEWGAWLVNPDKAELRGEARAQGWGQHGPRWLCPQCAHEHTEPPWL